MKTHKLSWRVRTNRKANLSKKIGKLEGRTLY
jgi:hypothetical protein